MNDTPWIKVIDQMVAGVNHNTPTGYKPDLDAAVRERQAAPVAMVRIVVPDLITGLNDYHTSPWAAATGLGWNECRKKCIDNIRAAGCVPVDAKGEEL